MSYSVKRALNNAGYTVSANRGLAITVIVPAGLEMMECYLAVR